MPPATPPPTVIPVANLSNREFLERYARPGCVGLLQPELAPSSTTGNERVARISARWEKVKVRGSGG